MTTGFTPDEVRILESEAIFGVQRRERFAWIVAAIGGATGLIAVGAVALMLPLKETEAFLAIVDKDTGIAQRAVTVQRAALDHTTAIEQSLIYSYVVDRETYDPADNEARILRANSRSTGQAQQSLKALWQEDNPNFPPVVYGSGARATIDILSINEVAPNTAQVKFTKTLTAPDEPRRVGKFYATVRFEFRPQSNANLELVWKNPFGFTVTSYRVTSETGGN